jgi:potassium/hydrogen antiporter
VTILLFGILVVLGVLSTKLAKRTGVPLLLVFLGIGMLVGSDALNLIWFGDAALAQRIANIALIFILFESGFYTKRAALRATLGPSLTLATLGIAVTAAAIGLAGHFLLKIDLTVSFLIGAIVSSTDAAAVVNLMRQSPVRTRVSTTLEVESAANDPMAILLTTMLIGVVGGSKGGFGRLALELAWQLGGGVMFGWLGSRLGVLLFNRLDAENRGYYYVLMVGLALLCYGVGDVSRSSGILAVFFCGYWMGNAEFAFKRGVSHTVEGMASICTMAIFLLLGLLVFPRTMVLMWKDGLILAGLIIFVARPLAVLVSTAPFRYTMKERIFLMWGGVKGAVPIVLATYPAAMGLPNGQFYFDVVFFAVFLTCLVQGSTLPWVARLLGLSVPAKPRALYSMELISRGKADVDIVEVSVERNGPADGRSLAELSLPRDMVVSSVVRGEHIITPRGDTRFKPDDVVFVMAPVRLSGEINTLINGEKMAGQPSARPRARAGGGRPTAPTDSGRPSPKPRARSGSKGGRA